jgi:radical SAM superfamily enzyme with C-terminal helix-hairpin-helix motif
MMERAAKIKAMKLEIQDAAVKAARKFRELETNGGYCGQCEFCQEAIMNLSELFSKAMSRELSALFAAGMARRGREENFMAIDGFIPKDRLN